MKKFLLRIARIGVFAYLGLMLFLAACQNRLLYFPSRAAFAALEHEAEGEGLAPWKDSSGTVIGWRTTAPSASRRIVVFHGNAGYAVHRAYYSEALGWLGWEVFLFEYPGYGARDGTPGRAAFFESSKAAISELLASDPRPLYLLGESVGSGTATALAAEFPDRIHGLALVIPFARLIEVARWHFPYLPVGLLLRDKYDNIANLEKYHGPVAVAVAENDEVVSPQQGRKLYEAYAGPKLLLMLPGASHNDFPTHASADWWKPLSGFLTSGQAASATPSSAPASPR